MLVLERRPLVYDEFVSCCDCDCDCDCGYECDCDCECDSMFVLRDDRWYEVISECECKCGCGCGCEHRSHVCLESRPLAYADF